MSQTTWAQRARSHYATRELFGRISEHAVFCGDLFFGVRRSRIGAIGAHVEVHQERAADRLVATTLTYVAPYEAVHREMAAQRFEIDLSSANPEEIPLLIPCVGGARIYSMTIMISMEVTPPSVPRIVSARAQLLKDKAAAREDRFFDIDIAPVTFRGLNHNVYEDRRPRGTFVDRARCLCPSCFGIGSEQSMRIPESDLKSGLSGYALFSCNKINGRSACVDCGGGGGQYLDWFLDEHPEMGGLGFRQGTGVLKRE